MITWLLLSYTLPAEPSALRVRIWRKLKRTYALLLQDAFWVLPATPRTREQYQWLTAEIAEMGGEVSYWEAQLVMGLTDETLIRQFQEQVGEDYGILLKQIESGTEDLESVAWQYQQLLKRDYFLSEPGQRVRQAILETRGEKV